MAGTDPPGGPANERKTRAIIDANRVSARKGPAEAGIKGAEKSAEVIRFWNWNGVNIILCSMSVIPFFSAIFFAIPAPPRFDSIKQRRF
jgi:hypothetical protein